MYITSKSQAMRWGWKALLGTALTPLLLASGCQTNTGTGLLAGGAIGALAGGAIGAATHHAGTGALIGAAAGSTIGGLAGASEDHHERQMVRADAERRALGLQDVVELTKSGTSDQIIINQINTSGTIYHLSGAEIQWLHDNGVRDAVIETMQATASRPPVYIRERPAVVYVEPPPPPPPIGVGFVFHGGR
jgi:hypothetical protein